MRDSDGGFGSVRVGVDLPRGSSNFRPPQEMILEDGWFGDNKLILVVNLSENACLLREKLAWWNPLYDLANGLAQGNALALFERHESI